ncbi:MAG: PhzF family phenazine biosynthesis protein [Alphaproteobacteria bacterium]|nr:PhzF family phenazine biosynthesis protein [Alphaproteobacteria bacterium]
MDCTIVDVFAERPLSGNQLAVVRDASHLDIDAMQAIALEMNFSETTFVMDERSDEARVRIFTPTRELPFAGHPTLGTAWVLGRHRDSYTLHLQAGSVPVTFEPGGMAWMQPPPVKSGKNLSAQSAAALLGLAPNDIDERYPCRFATIGPTFVLIGVKGLDALRRARIRFGAYESLAGNDEPDVFVFTEGSYNDDAVFAARMFHERGRQEDPATGSANTAFAAHIRSLGADGRIVVEQGFEIGRPSRLYLDVSETIRVGGKVHPVLTGRFDF